jgi:glycosyltransferase involved in cell wall biosynthesis
VTVDRSERVDIILPTHHRPHTLVYALQSVLAQTHSHFELHVVGDGCQDVTAEIVISLRDPRVRLHRFPKGRGCSYAHRNQVLRRTSAPYVAYMTDDDLWFPDHLERALAALRSSPEGLVAFRACHVMYPDRLDPYFFSFDWRRRARSAFLRNWFMGSVECVHRRGVLETAGYWNEALYRFGDREFYNRVRKSGAGARYVDTATVMRFYAVHWNDRYAGLDEPPQKRYLKKLSDPAWRAWLRQATARSDRPLAVRWRQWRDCVGFGVRYAPRFARFWYERFPRAPMRRPAW